MTVIFHVAKWFNQNCISGVIINDEKKMMTIKGLDREFPSKVSKDGTIFSRHAKRKQKR